MAYCIARIFILRWSKLKKIILIKDLLPFLKYYLNTKHCLGLAAQDFLLSLIPILSTSLLQELTSIFILSSLSLVNSGTLCLILYFHQPTTWTLSKDGYQDTCMTKLTFVWILFSLYGHGGVRGFFFMYNYVTLGRALNVKRKKKKKNNNVCVSKYSVR